jgi:hypothetical protein
MRDLFRSALALFAVGLAMIGCNRSSSSGGPEDPSDQGPIDAPYQAAFRVPGMT